MRKAIIKIQDTVAGHLTQDENGYTFEYEINYCTDFNSKPISLTLPLQKEKFISKTLFAFFDGLIPEGWLLEIAENNWKINPRDRMGLLLTCCKDCIGAVSVHSLNDSVI
jgi:serine/threonine-protein kinase HipA